MQKLIEKLVREEIRRLVDDQQPLIDTLVAQGLKTELRAQVRRAILQAIAPDPSPTCALPVNKAAVPAPDTQASATDAAPETPCGRYVYCVFKPGSQPAPDNLTGIDDQPVRIIYCQGLCAAVHNSPAAAYQSQDKDQVKAWVRAHETVIEAIVNACGAVVPMSFDTIVRPTDELSADDNLRQWLEQNQDRLTQTIDRIDGRAEYGVQIFWDKQDAARALTQADADIKELTADIDGQPEGLAYMNRHRLEKLIQQKLEAQADQLFQSLTRQIKPQVADMRIQAVTAAEDQTHCMLINLACLMDAAASCKLGQILDEIDAREGISVRYTGPWPPYSFV